MKDRLEKYRAVCELVEQCLKEGCTPKWVPGPGHRTAVHEAARRWRKEDGSGISTTAFKGLLDRAKGFGIEPNWGLYSGELERPSAHDIEPKHQAEPRAKTSHPVRRFLLTAAQDDTAVFMPFWENLLAYARHLGAEVMVGGFTYQKGLFEDHAARSAVFAEVVRPYLRHERVALSGDILFCAEMNTLPTAVRPLSSLDTYTQGKWGVFPHAKVQLVSVPTHFTRHPAMLMTTGACTVPNYVEKKAGLKAAFHHIYGATIVEIDTDGVVFCRQISATDDGAFQDLDLRVRGGVVSAGHRVEAITPGDIHVPKVDPDVARALWGVDVEAMQRVGDGMIDHLRPRYQFMHDLIDFAARNHHRRGDHVFRFATHVAGRACVDAEFRAGARFLRCTARDFCQTVVIPSNHNDAFPRWLREEDGRKDEANALFWFEANAAMLRAIYNGEPDFDVVRWALARHDPAGLDDIAFPPRDASFLICQDQGGIENIYHGDKGPNGARGTPQALVRVSTRLNTAHTHVAGILDGVYTAGLSGLMDQGYNADAPSSWTHTAIVTYCNGKRTLVTMRGARYRAPAPAALSAAA